MVLCSLISLLSRYKLWNWVGSIIIRIEIDLRIVVVVEHQQGAESRPLQTNKITLYGEDTLEAAVTDLEGMLRKVNPPEASWKWMLRLFLLVTLDY